MATLNNATVDRVLPLEKDSPVDSDEELPSVRKLTIIPLLHPKRQPGSDKIWLGDFESSDLPIMMVDGSTKETLSLFRNMIDQVTSDDPSITHLSIHATKGEGWDWSDDPLNVGEIDDWVLLKSVEAVTLPSSTPPASMNQRRTIDSDVELAVAVPGGDPSVVPALLEILNSHSELSEIKWIDNGERADIVFVSASLAGAIELNFGNGTTEAPVKTDRVGEGNEDSLDETARIRAEINGVDSHGISQRTHDLVSRFYPNTSRVMTTDHTPSTLVDEFFNRILQKKLVVPITRCISEFKQDIHARGKIAAKMILSTPKTMHPEFYGEEVDPKLNQTVKAHYLHPKQVDKSGIKRKLDARFSRALDRKRESYHAIMPVREPEDSVYGHMVVGTEEHKASLKKASKILMDKHGIKLGTSDMSASQINIGLPWAAGISRPMLDLPLEIPDDYLTEIEEFGDMHLHGLALAYGSMPKDEFEDMNTRATVKVDSYQGFLTNTTSTIVRQMGWRVMESDPKGIFAFTDVPTMSVVGFRNQDSGGKIRFSITINDKGDLSLSRVYDGADTFPKGFPAEGTEGIDGARIRHVANADSLINDCMAPIPSYISDTKTEEYKMTLMVSLGSLLARTPGQPEFEEFWREGWESHPIVQKYAAIRGWNSFDEMMRAFLDQGEFTYTGDIGNFDGTTTEQAQKSAMGIRFTDEVMSAVDALWNAPVIGTTTGADGSQAYYVIDKTDPHTKTVCSLLPSGIIPTSYLGRTIVPGTLKRLLFIAFPTLDKEDFNSPATTGGFSPVSAWLADAGDDHSTFQMILFLMTGIPTRKCYETFRETANACRAFSITEEVPPMNAGFLAHVSEDGKLLDWSLSPSRCGANTTNPEHAKKATGILASFNQYENSVIGTKLEEVMADVTDVVSTVVYDFQTREELVEAAVEDDIALEEENSSWTAAERIAIMIGVPVNDVHWKYSYDELIDMGADPDLLDSWRKPLPPTLSKNPLKFFREDSLQRLSNKKLFESKTSFKASNLRTSR